MSNFKKSVLIIDDDKEILRVFKLALSLSGYSVHTANGGNEALELLSQIETPGLIVLDLTMPDMSGTTFLAIKASRPAIREIPVVLCSASTKVFELPPTIERLDKPLDFDALLKTAERYCG